MRLSAGSAQEAELQGPLDPQAASFTGRKQCGSRQNCEAGLEGKPDLQAAVVYSSVERNLPSFLGAWGKEGIALEATSSASITVSLP
jgi:hypothetical protein